MSEGQRGVEDGGTNNSDDDDNVLQVQERGTADELSGSVTFCISGREMQCVYVVYPLGGWICWA